jgi:hypothetical protein
MMALLALVVMVTAVTASGTVTVTTAENIPGTMIYTVAWTSDAAGAVTGNPSSGWELKSGPIRGRLTQVKYTPSSGATQPTDLYDATIVDSDGASLLVIDGVDYGANLSNATPKIIRYSSPVYLDGSKTLDVRLANAGNAKVGTVQLWVER